MLWTTWPSMVAARKQRPVVFAIKLGVVIGHAIAGRDTGAQTDVWHHTKRTNAHSSRHPPLPCPLLLPQLLPVLRQLLRQAHRPLQYQLRFQHQHLPPIRAKMDLTAVTREAATKMKTSLRARATKRLLALSTSSIQVKRQAANTETTTCTTTRVRTVSGNRTKSRLIIRMVLRVCLPRSILERMAIWRIRIS